MASLFGALFSKLNFDRKAPILRNVRLESSSSSNPTNGKLHQSQHKVNNLERRFLVWTGKYKSVEEVPAYVVQNVMERARNRMRIRIANYMMLATVVGCVVMVYLGKQDKKQGKSVTQQNLDWHKQIADDDKAKKAQAK